MKAEKIVFIVKNKSGLPLSTLEKKKLGKKVSKVVSKIAASNRVALFQTSDDQSDLAVMVKNGIGNGRSELYNIFSRGVADCVSHTISYIEKYAPVEKVLVIFVDNREFIAEFVRQKFVGKKLSYDPATDHDSVKIFDCINITLRSA